MEITISNTIQNSHCVVASARNVSYTLTFQATNPQLKSFSINNELGEVRTKSIAPFIFTYQPKSQYAYVLQVRLAEGFSLPPNNPTLACLVNDSFRIHCFFASQSPLIISLDSYTQNSKLVELGISPFPVNSRTKFSISTEDLPENGIIYPSSSKHYFIWLQTFSSNSTQPETIVEEYSDLVFVKPNTMLNLIMTHFIQNVGAETFLKIKLSSQEKINSSNNSAIFIKSELFFPTAPGQYALDLGTGLPSGSYLPCLFKQWDKFTGKEACKLTVSKESGIPAIIEFINFPDYDGIGTPYIFIGKIRNPTSKLQSINLTFSVSSYSIVNNSRLEYFHYETYSLALDLKDLEPFPINQTMGEVEGFLGDTKIQEINSTFSMNITAGNGSLGTILDRIYFSLPSTIVSSIQPQCSYPNCMVFSSPCSDSFLCQEKFIFLISIAQKISPNTLLSINISNLTAFNSVPATNFAIPVYIVEFGIATKQMMYSYSNSAFSGKLTGTINETQIIIAGKQEKELITQDYFPIILS